MGRSTETFSKKEKEKKRIKKALDKKEKAEDRKSNSNKGKGLDEMMAYIDEDGNISSTPPDPSRKKKFNSDDIQIGVARQEEIPMDTERTGKITFFNDSKGYGFITDLQTQESIFVHMNAFIDPVKENDKVTFETEKGQKGLNAIKVKKAPK